MSLRTNMPSADEIEAISNNLDGCEGVSLDSLGYALNELGFDKTVKEIPEFLTALDDHVFLCDYCCCWRQTGERVMNESASDDMCEECDEKYIVDDE